MVVLSIVRSVQGNEITVFVPLCRIPLGCSGTALYCDACVAVFGQWSSSSAASSSASFV